MRRTLLLTAALASLAAPAAAETILGVAAGNTFVRFDSATPGNVSILGAVAGLQAGETIIGIDTRPANGGIYALTSASRLYLVAFDGGQPVATQQGVDGTYALASPNVGVDFNPVPDRLRIVNSGDQNLRVIPETNALVGGLPDGTLAYDSTAADGDPVDVNAGANPNIVAAGYTNSVGPSPRTVPPGLGTTLYVLDADLDILAIQNPPNAGTLNTVATVSVGGVTLDITEGDSFDISGPSGIAYLLNDGGGLYTVDLVSGAATSLGAVDGFVLSGITVADVPAPATLALFGLGLAGFVAARRRG